MNALVSARKAEPKEDRDMVAAVAEAMCAYTLVHVVAILYITYQLRNKRSILQSRVSWHTIQTMTAKCARVLQYI